MSDNKFFQPLAPRSKFTPNDGHDLTYVQDVTEEAAAIVTEDGDIEIRGAFETLDCQESSIWCALCGRLGADEYEDHGISDDWQVL